jgi:hypothetical protein
VGVGSYGLMIAFVESILVFFCAVILSFILPKNWDELKINSLIGVFVLLTAIWTIIGQLFFLLEIRFPVSAIQAIASYEHPLWILYGWTLMFVGPSVLLSAYFVMFNEGIRKLLFSFFERLTTLTSLYLFFDVCGMIIVVIRNV